LNGLKILAHIAGNTRYRRLSSTREIALRQKIPLPYLEQLLVVLRKSGCIRSVRGRNGGYELSLAEHEITLWKIIEYFEGRPDMGHNETIEAPAASFTPISISEIGGELRDAVYARASRITLASILDRMSRRAPPEYVI
jgi:Rrf2 family protein